MADETNGEKILPALPRKKQRAREDGNIPRSQDLSAAVSLTAALVAMWALGPGMLRDLTSTTEHYFGNASFIQVELWNFQAITSDAILRLVKIVGPFMLLMLVAGVSASVLQVGFLIAPKALAPKASRINPLSGLKRMVSLRALVELIKSIFKLSLIGVIVYYAIRDEWPALAGLMELTPMGIVNVTGQFVLAIWWRVVLAMIALAILDYFFQRWHYEQDLRMTRREATDEAKDLEGDPRLKQRIRQVQRQLATQRMMADVPEAEVVITNPIRYAIALRYEEGNMEAPIVVAKGARLLAKRIRDIAIENDVPIVERPDLARALYRSVDIGGAVPGTLFRAVAEVLAYVYQIDRREAKRQTREKALRTMAEQPA